MTSSPLLLGQSQLYKAGVGLAVSGQRYSSESLDLAPPWSLLDCGSPKEEGPYLESQSQWLSECRCRL